uniref:Synaptogyrin n=1 Tax=Oncorhynchus mykiss TaxID=8022 RepID=A0A8C7ST74_ONCMY
IAYGASLAGGGFDFHKFAKQPHTIVRFLSWIFSIVVFSCITAEGFVNKSHSPDAHCVFNQNDSACHYAVGIGVIAFLACFFFLLLDAYMPLMSNAKERKYAVMADLGFSVVWTFLWFVCFCLLTSQWSRTLDVKGIPQDAARSAIAFSFFSIATWVRRTVTTAHTPYPPTYAPSAYTPTTYSPYPSSAPDDFQQPPFTPSTITTTTQPQGEYQPPNY